MTQHAQQAHWGIGRAVEGRHLPSCKARLVAICIGDQPRLIAHIKRP